MVWDVSDTNSSPHPLEDRGGQRLPMQLTTVAPPGLSSAPETRTSEHGIRVRLLVHFELFGTYFSKARMVVGAKIIPCAGLDLVVS
jgi:hypothetical protein